MAGHQAQKVFKGKKVTISSNAAKSTKIRTWNWPSDLAIWRSPFTLAKARLKGFGSRKRGFG